LEFEKKVWCCGVSWSFRKLKEQKGYEKGKRLFWPHKVKEAITIHNDTSPQLQRWV